MLRVGSKGAGGLSVSCLHSGSGVKTLRRRGRERGGAAVRPRGRCWLRLGGGRLPAGAARFGVLSFSPPPSLGARETAGRAGLQPPGSPTPTPCFPRARPGLRRSFPPSPLPLLVGAVPLPLPLLKMAAPASEVGGDCIRRPPLALSFFPSPALLAPPGCASPPPARRPR